MTTDPRTVIPVPNAEADFRVAMFQAETEGKYEDAALAALGLAEMVGVRSPEGALYCAQRAQVYATLHQADTALWISENRRDRRQSRPCRCGCDYSPDETP